MHTEVSEEYLGDIDPKQLRTILLNLFNTNNFSSSIPEIFGCAVIEGDTPMMVMGEFEYSWEGDPKTSVPTERRPISVRIKATS